LDHPRRVRHHPRRHLEKGGADAQRVRHSDAFICGLPREEFRNDVSAFFGDVGYLL